MKHQATASRRRFLASAVSAGATLKASSWSSLVHGDSPNHRIRIGVIGVGVRGKYLIGNLPESAQVTAICDCARSRIAGTIAPKEERFVEVLADFVSRDAARCATHYDYRQMIDRERLDAVIIATPDHHHVPAAMLALDAGLDVYLEKPLSLTIGEGRLLADRVKSTGRVLQVGSQQRTMEINRFACEFVRDGGLGKLHRVELPNYPGPIITPAYPAQSIPDGLDWDLFLGPTPNRPHNRRLWIKDEFKVDGLVWRGWDLHVDYSGHMMTNWGAHSVDMVQYALGMDESGPVSIHPDRDADEASVRAAWQDRWSAKTPAAEGDFLRDRRFCPVSLRYPDGTELRLRPGVNAATFYGERGQMMISRNRFKTDPPDLVQDGPDERVAEKWKGGGFVARPHLENWLECIRDRTIPNAPVEVGHRSASVCHLVNLARQLDRPLHWDPQRETFPNDDQAGALLNRPRRPGWELSGVG